MRIDFYVEKANPSLRVSWRQLKTRADNWCLERYGVKTDQLNWQVLHDMTQVDWTYNMHKKAVVGGIVGPEGGVTFTMREEQSMEG